MKTILDFLNTPVLTILALAGFLLLASYSYDHAPHEQGYTVSVFSVLDKPSLLQRQAKALKDVYGLTDEDAVKPVILWREQ